jgi:DNA repair protein RadA/Sms
VQFAKTSGVAVVLAGHVTKSGDVAGPRVLEHMVDAVLCLEGSERADFRLLKGIKNRCATHSPSPYCDGGSVL